MYSHAYTHTHTHTHTHIHPPKQPTFHRRNWILRCWSMSTVKHRAHISTHRHREVKSIPRHRNPCPLQHCRNATPRWDGGAFWYSTTFNSISMGTTTGIDYHLTSKWDGSCRLRLLCKDHKTAFHFFLLLYITGFEENFWQLMIKSQQEQMLYDPYLSHFSLASLSSSTTTKVWTASCSSTLKIKVNQIVCFCVYW